MARLMGNIRALDLPAPPAHVIRRWVDEACLAFAAADGRMRLTVYRDYAGWGIACDADAVLVSIVISDVELRPDDRGLVVIGHDGLRKPPAATLDMRIKAGANYYVLKEWDRLAKRCGADDAITLSASGCISEATVENVFWVAGGVLFTPEISDRTNCLPGVTREKVMALAERHGISCETGCYELDVLDGAEDLFLTGTSAGIAHVAKYNGRVVGCEPGPVCALLGEAYQALLQGSAGASARPPSAGVDGL